MAQHPFSWRQAKLCLPSPCGQLLCLLPLLLISFPFISKSAEFFFSLFASVPLAEIAFDVCFLEASDFFFYCCLRNRLSKDEKNDNKARPQLGGSSPTLQKPK